MKSSNERRRRVRAYISEDGACPFEDWFAALPPAAAARVVSALTRLEHGLGDLKPVGQGVSELRIHWGPGLRIYFGQDGPDLVILLCAGTKKRQKADIARALQLWEAFGRRKRRG